MRNAFIDRVIEECGRRDDIFILSGDAGLGVFDGFQKSHPDRFRNMGVAEQNTISFAAGLAMTGYRVLVYNIAPFVLYRCYEQVRNDICYQELPVVLIGTGSGITYAPMGMSHYAVEDLGLAQTLPNLSVISPMDPVEAKAAAEYALTCAGPLYVRLAKRGEPVYHLDDVADITLPQVIRNGKDTALLFHGSIAVEVMAAWETLRQQGLAPVVISVPTVQPLAVQTLSDLLATVGHVVCVEEHFTTCGLGRQLAALKVELSARWGLTSLGIPPRFIHDVADTQELRSLFGIAAGDIVRAVENVRR
jgi:transketolase